MSNVLKIKDLPYPVMAAKSNWSAAGDWLGFTPTGKGSNAYSQCQSTINRQIKNGYIVEYITKSVQHPNDGFENDPAYLKTLAKHSKIAGRLIAVHKPYFTSRPLEQIIGKEHYNHIQDVWAKSGQRSRWSVAFPSIEKYRIIDPPLIKDILSPNSYKNLVQRSSATLRELTEIDKKAIAELKIEKVEVNNTWIIIDDEIRNAELSEINSEVFDLISTDFDQAALEGETDDRKIKIKKRAAWLADKFVRRRIQENTLVCDYCNYDPKLIIESENKYYRSLLDVHHLNPLSEGIRYTTENDFRLLCPNCHRLEHVKIRMKSEAVN